MFALHTTSMLGLDLGLVSLPAAPSSTLSANGTFAVESYTPTEGCVGNLITVVLTCFNTMLPANDQDQVGDFRLIINDKKLCSRVEHGSDGKVILRALLSTSLASLRGLVPMNLQLHRDGMLFDCCNFGHFNFVPVPMSMVSPSSPPRTPSKRDRDDEIQTPSPKSKKSKLFSADPVSACDSRQAKLIIETDIAQLGDLSTWSPAEIKEGRRFVRLMRQQQGSSIHLRMLAVSMEEVALDDRNVINCMFLPRCGDEPSVSSVDIIKAIGLLVNPSDRRLSIEEKNRVRRNIDTLRPTTLKKGDESLNWIMQLRSPRPITMAKDVKIFKWSSLEAALVKIMKKYSYQDDGSFIEQRASPRPDKTTSALWETPALHGVNQEEQGGATPPTPPAVSARDAASSETNPLLTACDSPVSLVSAPSSVGEPLDMQSLQSDATFLEMFTSQIDQNLLELAASLTSTPTSSESSLPSDCDLLFGLDTPADRNPVDFNVESGYDAPANGSEFLDRAELEALLGGTWTTENANVTTSDSSAPELKLCEPIYQPSEGLLSVEDIEALLGGALLAPTVDDGSWDMNQSVSLPPFFSNVFGLQDTPSIVF